MSVKIAEAGSIKEGSYIVIEDVPCRVVEVEKSKTGKHGSTKVRIVGVSIIDNTKKVLTVPSDAQVNIPIIDKKFAQVINVGKDTVQLMDLKTYEFYEVSKPQELADKLAAGMEVEVWEVLGYKFISRIK
ncbi:MAG: translation initiation factor IF-5A [Thermoproteota archaeon]|jgi:translation initiation factor 5A|nr:translation initiation factor IF-5A [Thermoproteota archaeon]